MPVDPPFNVYRDQLTSHYHGLALWNPNPPKTIYNHVSIGDVGYVQEGVFIRMFNVILPWDHESNRTLGEPEPYESLDCGPFPKFLDVPLKTQEHYSRYVSIETNDSNAQAKVPEDAEGVTYNCRGHGALLFLPHGGRRADIIHTKVFEDYIKDHVVSWFTWAQKNRQGVERMEDLVLVSGCTLVSSWAAAAFVYSTMEAKISLARRTLSSHNGGECFVWGNIRGAVEYHDSDINPCVFVRGFRAKRVLFWTKPMRAAAEPRPDDPDDHRDDEIQVTRVADGPKYRDPLIAILDYIEERCSKDAQDEDSDTIAIAHDDDLRLIKDVEILTADTIEEFLREKQMPLLIENGGMWETLNAFATAAILRDSPTRQVTVERHEYQSQKETRPPIHEHRLQTEAKNQQQRISFDLPPWMVSADRESSIATWPLIAAGHQHTSPVVYPSDFHSSVETPPAIVPLSETPTSDGGYSPSSSSACPSPYQHQISLGLKKSSVSAAWRGGCWTCRLRRKKCDEQHEEGWGPRRPDWMRDKEAVQAYKTNIKTHLLRLGLIRGQPRTSLTTGMSTPASKLVGTPNTGLISGIASVGSERGSFSYPDHQQPGYPFPSNMASIPGNAPISSSSPSFSGTWVQYDISQVMGPGAASLAARNFSNLPGAGGFQWAMQPTGHTDEDAAVKREHLAYYFNHVRGLQFLFTCKTALDAVQAVVLREAISAGALTDALCAIASRQHAKAQRRVSLPADGGLIEETQSHLFFNQGAYQLDAARRQGRCTQAEAMAAIHLISYSLVVRGGVVAGANASVGGTEWTPMLELACDWLAQTGMHVDENPRLFIMNMPLPAAYAAKVTWFVLRLYTLSHSEINKLTCMDIFMGVTLRQPPRLLALYRCTEQVLLAFAEIAALAQWKNQEAQEGKLSVRELVLRGNVIEQGIRQTMLDPMAFEGSRVAQADEDTCRRILATILQECALLYLSTVLSGNSPGVPETQSSLNNILNLFEHMPIGRLDLGLVLPLAFAGFMADAPAARDMIHKRLRQVGSVCSSVHIRQIEGVMTEVWSRRDAGQREVEWREVMQERGLTLLMI
ncbi:fungal-specific transcription factor domain-containing protein [Russula aff. rugulosa BPL654]|nr:fungal-specific transcription factor domain-containing protein [Russula aff. rugulosa BPL654]